MLPKVTAALTKFIQPIGKPGEKSQSVGAAPTQASPASADSKSEQQRHEAIIEHDKKRKRENKAKLKLVHPEAESAPPPAQLEAAPNAAPDGPDTASSAGLSATLVSLLGQFNKTKSHFLKIFALGAYGQSGNKSNKTKKARKGIMVDHDAG